MFKWSILSDEETFLVFIFWSSFEWTSSKFLIRIPDKHVKDLPVKYWVIQIKENGTRGTLAWDQL